MTGVQRYRVPTDRDTGKFVVKNSAVEIKLPEMKGEFEIAFTITAKRFKNLGKGDKCRAGAGLLIREFNDRKGDEKALLATPVDDFGGGGGDGVSPKISNVEYSPGRETFGGFDVGSTLEKGETVREQVFIDETPI